MTALVLFSAAVLLLIFFFFRDKYAHQNPSKSDSDFIRDSFERAISHDDESDEEPSDPKDKKSILIRDRDAGEPAFIVLDVETSGLRKFRNKDPKHLTNWPRIVQLAYQVYDQNDQLIDSVSVIFKQPRPLPADAIQVHGITDEMCKSLGVKPDPILQRLYKLSQQIDFMVAHNATFDHDVVEANMRRFKIADDFEVPLVCTMDHAKRIEDFRPLDVNGRKKNGRLEELHQYLFDESPARLHDAEADTLATARCFFELRQRGIINIEFV